MGIYYASELFEGEEEDSNCLNGEVTVEEIMTHSSDCNDQCFSSDFIPVSRGDHA